jgi:hypothetical protein
MAAQQHGPTVWNMFRLLSGNGITGGPDDVWPSAGSACAEAITERAPVALSAVFPGSNEFSGSVLVAIFSESFVIFSMFKSGGCGFVFEPQQSHDLTLPKS